jgi:opacity protein-like surface antigen
VSIRGLSVAATANYRSWFGATTELGVSFWPQDSGDPVQMWSLLVGGKFTVRRPAVVKPYAQVLAGLTYSRSGPVAVQPLFDGWDSLWQVGGGVDIVLSSQVAVRAGLDGRVLSDKFLSGETTTQVRFSLGVTFFHGPF